MTATTVQPPDVRQEPDPERTDRYPEVQAIVDAWVAPAETDQDGGE